MSGLYEIAKIQPNDPITELAKWLLKNNPNKPQICDFNHKMLDEIDLLTKYLHENGNYDCAGSRGNVENNNIIQQDNLYVIQEMDENNL